MTDNAGAGKRPSSSSLTRHCRDSKISRLSSPGDFISRSLDSLPETLLLEILIRLPCKSCFKFKSVSKRWGSLISDSYFIRRYIYFNSRVNTNPRFNCESDDSDGLKDVTGKRKSFPFTVVSRYSKLILTNPVFNSSGFSLRFLPFATATKARVFVVASSKDLLLCSPSEYYETSFYVCNPLTQQFIRLPNAPRRIRDTRVGFIVEPFYRFNSDRDTVDLNYGYRYLVAQFVFPRCDKSVTKVEIATYDSEVGKWEVFVPDNPDLFSYVLAPLNVPILANCGMLHWWSYDITRFGLVSFDPWKKHLVLTAKPEDMERAPMGHGEMVCLGSCQDRIHVYQFLQSEVDPILSIWELQDSNLGNWHLLHRVCIKDMNTHDQLLGQENRLMKPTPRHIRYSEYFKEFNLRRILNHPDDEELVYIVFDTCFALYNKHTMTLTPVAQISPQKYFALQSGLLFPLHLQCFPTPINSSRKRHHRAG